MCGKSERDPVQRSSALKKRMEEKRCETPMDREKKGEKGNEKPLPGAVAVWL